MGDEHNTCSFLLQVKLKTLGGFLSRLESPAQAARSCDTHIFNIHPPCSVSEESKPWRALWVTLGPGQAMHRLHHCPPQALGGTQDWAPTTRRETETVSCVAKKKEGSRFSLSARMLSVNGLNFFCVCAPQFSIKWEILLPSR